MRCAAIKVCFMCHPNHLSTCYHVGTLLHFFGACIIHILICCFVNNVSGVLALTLIIVLSCSFVFYSEQFFIIT